MGFHSPSDLAVIEKAASAEQFIAQPALTSGRVGLGTCFGHGDAAFLCCASAKMLREKRHHAIPRQAGCIGIIDIRAPFVEKAVGGVVAVNLSWGTGFLQGGFQGIDHAGHAPVVLVGKVSLKGNADIDWIGKFLRRNTIETDGGRECGHMHGGGDGERATHAKTDGAHLTTDPLQVRRGAMNVLVRGAGKVEAIHHVARLVRVLRDTAVIKVGR